MAGITALRKIQMGPESTSGTPVAATTVWRGMGILDDTKEVKQVDESIGVAIPTLRHYVPKLGCQVVFDPVEATFQQIPYIFEAGVAVETATQDGAGTDYIYAYDFPTTAQNTIRTYTIEMGDDQLAQETDYAFVEAFKISGNAAEGVMMESTWQGRDVVDTTFTAAQTAPTLVAADNMVFGGSTFSIDATSGGYGGTAKASTLLSFELDVTTGYKPKFTNLGKDFDFVYFDRGSFAATLKVVYEHNAIADAQRDIFEAGTPQLYQLLFAGATVGTPGTTYSNMTFIINAAGTYTSFTRSDVDGNSTVEAEIQIGYDLTDATGLGFIVVNELSALP